MTDLNSNTRTQATVTPQEAHRSVQNQGATLLDVRGFEEFAASHAEGATCIPLPDLEKRVGEIPTDCSVLLMCQSGGRSAIAVERLRALGMNNIIDVAGGFNSWRQEGLPTVKQTSAMPLERQVRIAAGILVFGFSVAGFLLQTAFFYGAAAVGFMLAFTGILSICPMMAVLRLMPWNRVHAASCSA